jgi:hypothetical protein
MTSSDITIVGAVQLGADRAKHVLNDAIQRFEGTAGAPIWSYQKLDRCESGVDTVATPFPV